MVFYFPGIFGGGGGGYVLFKLLFFCHIAQLMIYSNNPWSLVIDRRNKCCEEVIFFIKGID